MGWLAPVEFEERRFNQAMCASEKKYYYSKTLDRAFVILESFLDDNKEQNVTEISKKVGLNKSTVHRLVLFMQERGYLEYDAAISGYRLGTKFVVLGRAVLNQLDIRYVVKPYLETLSKETGKTAHLVVFDHSRSEGVYIDKVEDPNTYVSYSQVGKSLPLHCTAVGKVLLSHYDEPGLRRFLQKIPLIKLTENTITDQEELIRHIALVKEQGYAIDDCELEDHLVCISAPIRDYSGAIKAAISVSGMIDISLDPVTKKRLVDTVVRVAANASKQLGYDEHYNKILK